MRIQGARPGRPRRSSRNVLVVLGAITVSSAASLAFLGWKLLEQDAALLATRERERLDLDADRVVQAFQRRLADVDVRLTELLEAKNHAAAGALPDFGLGVILTSGGAEAIPPGKLLFHPALPPLSRPEPPASLFTDAERLEFEQRAPLQAADAYRRLAGSVDPAVRAASLMRLARAQRTAGQLEAAAKSFRDMATLTSVRVFERPADLVARIESAKLLKQIGHTAIAQSEAQTLLRQVASGHWTLTRGQFESIVDDLDDIAGAAAPLSSSLSLVAGDLWNFWRQRQQPLASGPRLLRTSGAAVLVLSRSTADKAVAWLVEPRDLVSQLDVDPDVAFTLTDADGAIAATTAPTGVAAVVRASVNTHLPWTLHVARTKALGQGGSRTLVASGLILVLVFLAAGAFFIGRAIRRESDLARAQSDFVAAVSHEFRTPLAAMRQFAELLAAGRVATQEKRQHYFEALAGESRRLQKLVENLLNFGRLEAGTKPFHLEPVDLGELVRLVIDDYRSQLSRPDCRIEIADGDSAVVVRADRDAIGLALHNLLDNAVKYSGGDRPVRVGWTHRGDHIALSVRDEGPGISKDEQQRIFQRFVRGAAAESGNVRGTGIGLAMVKLVATGHGGDVLVDSRPGDGATFTMLLPQLESGILSARES